MKVWATQLGVGFEPRSIYVFICFLLYCVYDFQEMLII